MKQSRGDDYHFGKDTMSPGVASDNSLFRILLISASDPANLLGTSGAATLHTHATQRVIVPFPYRRRGAPGERRVKSAASQQLYDYWDRLRGARSAPERNDVDPAAIRGVLADTFILEYDRMAAFPLRIVGSRTNALFTRELRGQSFVGLWRREDRAELTDILASAADGVQPYLLGARAGPEGAPAIDVELLILPLRHHGATHARMIGVCTPRAAPTWLGLLPCEPLALISLRALRRDATGIAQAIAVQSNFQRHGHLFVYSSSK